MSTNHDTRPYRKAVSIQGGEFVRMWWEHPDRRTDGRDDIDHESVLRRWREVYPEHAPFIDGRFLRLRGFAIVFIDGVQMPEEWGRGNTRPSQR